MSHADLILDPHFTVGRIDRRLFGSFVEHLGRCVYDGIYEPGHPTANADGFRQDVIELVRELGTSTIRYPGGNFVSGYRWEDGVGPREQRPNRLDLAWHSIESNDVGLDEFAGWLKDVDAELMYAVNLGTRGTQEALDVLEYANIASGTALSDQRITNGTEKPHGIRMWCLGNEMDGPWQLGHGTASDYAQLAAKTARAMRQVDPNLELVVCGSSSATMPTFGDWERTVLQETYDDIDFISCHAYYEPQGDDFASFLASAVGMDKFIDSVIATADHVKATRQSEKTINLSFDEWNVWYQDRYNNVEKITDANHWPVAPRLLEDSYSAMDAVVFGNLMISLLRHANRVTSASLAQLVNVIAPIMTEPNGPAWRQTTFYPFAITSRLAQGVVLELKLSSPSMATAVHGEVSMVDSVATYDEAKGVTSVFLVNRSLTEAVDIAIDTSRLNMNGIESAQTLHDSDIHAKNTLQDPVRVTPKDNTTARINEGVVYVTLPPVSWTALALH